jgi:mannosyltransferase
MFTEPNCRWKGDRLHAFAVIVPILVAMALRVPFLESRSIWYDEASSWQVARFPIAELFYSCTRNVHMPLYYLALKGWGFLWGDSVIALRSFSVLCGAGAAGGMSILAIECARQIGVDRKIPVWWFGMFSGLLVALNAFQIGAAIEVRMYAMGTLLSVLNAWLLLRIIGGHRSWKYWIAWTLSCSLLTYTHHHCLFLVSSGFLFLFVYAFKHENDFSLLRWTTFSAILVTVFYIPGAWLLFQQATRVRQNYWTEPLSWELVTRTFGNFVSPLIDWRFFDIGAVVALGFVVIAVFLIQQRRPPEILVVTLGWLPMLMAGLVTLTITKVWEPRFFRFCELFLLLSMALAWAKIAINVRHFSIGALGTLAVMVFVAIGYWRDREIPTRPGMQEAVRRIVEQAEPGALLVATSNIHYFPAKYYLRNESAVELRIMESSTKEFWGDHLIRNSDVIDNQELRSRLSGGIWLLGHSPIERELRGIGNVNVIDRFRCEYDIGSSPPWTVYASKLIGD